MITTEARVQAEASAERKWGALRPIQVPVVSAPIAAEVGPRAWFVLQTAMHGEDKVSEALGDLGFEAYTPVMRKQVYRRRKLVERELRLFNRYVFARLPVNTRDWKTVEDIEEIDYALGGNGVPCPIADAEIARFQRAQAAGEFDVLKATAFPIGSRIHVLSGPFGGFSGLVESLPGRAIVKAAVEIFGRFTPIEFPFDAVELA